MSHSVSLAASIHKRAKPNDSVDNFFPKYATRHAKENRLAHIKYRKQKRLIQSGPLRDNTGGIQLPLSEEYADALKGNLLARKNSCVYNK